LNYERKIIPSYNETLRACFTVQILLERYAYSEISGTFILI